MQYYDSTHLEEEMGPEGGQGGSVAGISLAALWDEEESEEELTLEGFDNSSVQVSLQYSAQMLRIATFSGVRADLVPGGQRQHQTRKLNLFSGGVWKLRHLLMCAGFPNDMCSHVGLTLPLLQFYMHLKFHSLTFRLNSGRSGQAEVPFKTS